MYLPIKLYLTILWQNLSHTELEHTVPSGCTGGDSCCTMDNKCNEGEGDCDVDSDCLDGLKCDNSLNNCATTSGLEWDSTDDCCYRPGATIPYKPSNVIVKEIIRLK